MKEKVQYEIQPLNIYDLAVLHPGMQEVTFDFAANPESEQFDRLYDLKESELIEKALNPPAPLSSILRKLNIKYPQCWIALEVPKEKLFKTWKYELPGDVDVIAGNLQEERMLFDYIVAIQVKIRKIRATDELRAFPSGIGTRQSHYTTLMGFDRTMLLHFIVREPKGVPEGFGASWNPIVNADFGKSIRACYGIVKERLGRERSGYGILGWEQAYGEKWNVCGGFLDEILIEPPLQPLKDSAEVRRARKFLEVSLGNMFRGYADSDPPYIFGGHKARW